MPEEDTVEGGRQRIVLSIIEDLPLKYLGLFIVIDSKDRPLIEKDYI